MNDSLRRFLVEAERFSQVQDRISDLKGRQAHVIFPETFALLLKGNKEALGFFSEAARCETERELSLATFKLNLKNLVQENALKQIEFLLERL